MCVWHEHDNEWTQNLKHWYSLVVVWRESKCLSLLFVKAKTFMNTKRKRKCVILTFVFENENVIVKCVDYHKLSKLINIWYQSIFYYWVFSWVSHVKVYTKINLHCVYTLVHLLSCLQFGDKQKVYISNTIFWICYDDCWPYKWFISP
jgi:hypothetical protein